MLNPLEFSQVGFRAAKKTGVAEGEYASARKQAFAEELVKAFEFHFRHTML